MRAGESGGGGEMGTDREWDETERSRVDGTPEVFILSARQ